MEKDHFPSQKEILDIIKINMLISKQTGCVTLDKQFEDGLLEGQIDKQITKSIKATKGGVNKTECSSDKRNAGSQTLTFIASNRAHSAIQGGFFAYITSGEFTENETSLSLNLSSFDDQGLLKNFSIPVTKEQSICSGIMHEMGHIFLNSLALHPSFSGNKIQQVALAIKSNEEMENMFMQHMEYLYAKKKELIIQEKANNFIEKKRLSNSTKKIANKLLGKIDLLFLFRV